MTDELTLDLNQTIAAAVNARVEAEVLKALSGDAVLSEFVSAALRQPVEVKDNRTYRTEQVPFLTLVLRKAIQEATKAVTQRVVLEETEKLEEYIRKAIRAQLPDLAAGLVKSVTDTATHGYGINVTCKVTGRGE